MIASPFDARYPNTEARFGIPAPMERKARLSRSAAPVTMTQM